MNTGAHLVSYYLSRDRVLSLIDPRSLPHQILGALQERDVAMSSAILSNVVGSYLLEAIASGDIKTLQQLAFESGLQPGSPFIYNGHFTGKGFGVANKGPSLTLTEKLDEPLSAKKLIFEFAKDGLINATAYTRLSGSQRSLFAFGYITDIDAETIRAVPYVIGDLTKGSGGPLNLMFSAGLEVPPENIRQFAGMDSSWFPSKKEFGKLALVPEHEVKALICLLVGEHEVPNDWGGEESDVFTANLLVGDKRQTAAFLLKGPAAFHQMTMKDCGKNGDQIYRLFNIPAAVYIVQHCHNIGPAVRKTVEAFALQRALVSPCNFVFMDGVTTARLLRAHGKWPT